MSQHLFNQQGMRFITNLRRKRLKAEREIDGREGEMTERETKIERERHRGLDFGVLWTQLTLKTFSAFTYPNPAYVD